MVKIIIRIIIIILSIAISFILVYGFVAFITWDIYWVNGKGLWLEALRLMFFGVWAYNSLALWMYLKEQIDDGNK